MSTGADPVVAITGAASGIGAATAALFSRQGWRTAGLDLRPSTTDLSMTCDVTDAAAVRSAIDAVAGRFGGVHAAVTAAGYYEEGLDVCDITRAQWNSMLQVILGGTVNTCAAVLPHMIARQSGTIIAISSELAATPIRLNVVAPGPTDTPLLTPDSLWREPGYLATLPLGRLVRPEEVAATVYYLATEGRMYCGEVLSPNAGAVI